MLFVKHRLNPNNVNPASYYTIKHVVVFSNMIFIVSATSYIK